MFNQLLNTPLLFKWLYIPVLKKSPVFVFLLMGLLWNANAAHCQQTASKVLDSIQTQVSAQQPNITQAIAIWHQQMAISGPAAKIDSIKLYPVMRLAYLDQHLNLPVLSSDTSMDILAVTYPSRSVYVYNPHSAKLSLKGNTAKVINGIVDKALSSHARKLSFVYFFDIDRFQPDLLTFFENGNNLKFILSGNEAVLEANEVIDKKFGDKSTYFQARKNEKIRAYVMKNVGEKFKETALTDNWQFYAHFFPKDTSRIISLLVDDVKKTVKLPGNKLKELKKALLKVLREPQKEITIVYDDQTIRYYKYYGRSPYIVLMNKDIAPLLGASMDKQQFENYNIHAEINERLSAMMQKSLQARFNEDRAAVKAFVDNNLKNDGPIGYYIQNELHTPVRMIK